MNIKKVGVLCAIMLAMTVTTKAQNFVGDWKGAISIQGMSLEMIFHISEEGGAYASTLDVPMQGASGIPMDKTEVNGDELTILANALQAKFTGKIAGEEISGNFEQMGMTLPLVLQKFESKLPGNPALVTSDEDLKKMGDLDKGTYKYSVADYFARPKANSFQLSPNGKYLSYFEKDDNNKNHVYVKEIATGKVVRAIEEKDELIKNYG